MAALLRAVNPEVGMISPRTRERMVAALSAQNDQMAEDLARARGLKDVAAIRVSYPLIR